jgi:hypothetical protein
MLGVGKPIPFVTIVLLNMVTTTTSLLRQAPTAFPEALRPEKVTILAFGALLSEKSSRLTFPDLKDFRLVRLRNLRRVFAHPHLFLVCEGLVDFEQQRMASLSAEPCYGGSFIAASFTVTLDDEQRQKFMQREEEYNITTQPFFHLHDDDNPDALPAGHGVVCLASTDAATPQTILDRLPSNKLAFPSLWHWPKHSGLLPADIYLRHCLLAVENAGNEQAKMSFLHDTYLVDRQTTLADYLDKEKNRGRVMTSLPPLHLATRFGG